MSLSVDPIFKAMVRELHVPEGGRGERFAADFVTAFNRVLSELTRKANLATRLSHITGTASVQSALEADDEYVVAAGLKYYLSTMGYARENDDMSRLQAMWDDAVGDFIAAAFNELMEDDEEDVAFLGSKED